MTATRTPQTRRILRDPGPWHISNILDGRTLRTQLSAAALDNVNDPQAARARAIDLLHGALFRGRLIAQERLEQGADGLDTARLLAAVQDEVITALHDFVTTHVIRARNPTEGERLAIAATGGYGRSVLAPSSDIDLLFIRVYKSSAHTESLVEYILYALWDIGLKVGHAFRTPQECARLAKEDVTIKTSLLDARYIAGDEALSDETAALFRKEAVKGRDAKFIADKLAERDKRHARQGDARYVVEPNLKEGKGGLRDLQTLFWIAKHIHGGETLEDVMKTSFFTDHEYAVFIRAARYFWTLRCHLHYLTGRAEERLSFDLQPELAERMGYRDRKEQLGVERFMKRYFLAANDVGNLTRILSAKLEADQKKNPEGLKRFFPSPTPEPIGETGFLNDSGRISIASEDVFKNDPAKMIELFTLAEAEKVDVHPDALRRVTRDLKLIRDDVRTSEKARDGLFDALLAGDTPGLTLRRMNEAGLLGKVVPEFGGIVAQTQFNMYHHYTVDEHTIRAVEAIADIEHGRLQEHTLARELFQSIEHRRALYLAMLLHDTGKGLGDQQEEGMKTARAACHRLGLDEAETELVVWLVGHHLEMSETAQKRDISDPRTIADFTKLVGSLEHLRLLYVLTIADIIAVGPNVWNNWKGQLLRELYLTTEATLRGGRTSEGAIASGFAIRAEKQREALVEQFGAIPTVLLNMEDAYWTSFDVKELISHAELVRQADGTLAHTVLRKKTDATEIIVFGDDRPGLFSDLTGVIAGQGANIAFAQAFTSKEGKALDFFVVQDNNADAFGSQNPNRLILLEAALLQAMQSRPDKPQLSPKPSRRHAAFLVKPQVQIKPDASADCLVIDISGRDRPGLLHDIAQALTEFDLSIRSAHIASYGERMFDAFYVQTDTGGGTIEASRKDALRRRLLEAIDKFAPQPPRTPAKKLKQASSADSF